MELLNLIRKHRYFLGLLGITLAVVLIFLLVGMPAHSIGFPLDDAWIHQTYAKNLAITGSWSYRGTAISGGSTSPLWTVLISLGDLISISFGLRWTFALSIVAFLVLVICSWKALQKLVALPDHRLYLIPGLVMATEWHLLWSTGSGMETILFSAVIVFLFLLLQDAKIKWGLIGLLNGLLIWIRPDGLTLLGPILLVLFFMILNKKAGLKEFLYFLLPLVVILVAYIGFNFATTGRIFPNTFYAKQVEYQQLLLAPFLTRLFNEFAPIFTGAGILLLPGFLFEIWRAVQMRDYRSLAIILWIVGYGLLYAIRLPVVYQHGRYMFPIIAPYIVISFAGLFDLLYNLQNQKTQKLVAAGWLGTILILSMAFYTLGIKSYRADVEIIDQLMVRPAKWIAANVPANQTIAVHDIGALGYFTNNPLIDLAGLIDPEVIPYMHDEKSLLTFMKDKGAIYFLGFANWYKTSDSWGVVEKQFTAVYQGTPEEILFLRIK
jgi:hypothetical protein